MEVIDFNKQNSILNQFIAEIRDVNIQKDPLRFRRNIERIGEVMAIEAELSSILKTAVTIRWKGENGKLIIDCDSLEKLDIILQRLTADGEVDINS